MKKTYSDTAHTVYEDETGNRIILTVCENTRGKYCHIFAKPNGKKGKTIATRATYDRALAIGMDYFKNI